jgi:WD40 repeat protein
VWDVASGKPLMELEHNNAAGDHRMQIAISPDGCWLASAANFRQGTRQPEVGEGYYDIRLWDLATGKLARRLKPRRGAVIDAVFSADGTRLLTLCGEPGQPTIKKGDTGKLNELQLWDVATGAEVRQFRGYADRAICVAISADGRMIATGKYDSPAGLGGTNDNSLRLWEVATGTERGRIQGHENSVPSVDFSPDGRLLAAISDDAPIYIWDVYALEKSKLPGKGLTKDDKDKLWKQLAEEDAPRAFQAVRDLIATPADAVAIFQGGWKPVPRAIAQQMQKWIEELDSNQFGVRQQAEVELNRHFAGHETLLANAVQKATTLEQRQRLESILNRLHPESLRRTRMLEVLERIGVGPARQFLQSLAEQTDDAEMSREAKAGLKRLGG